MSAYSARRIGALHSAAYRVFVVRAADGKPVSPFHDIPMRNAETDAPNVVNMVVEIPRWTNAKMEISKQEFLNPIKQDQKKGALRYVNNVFPSHGYIWNYGAVPQTWDDPRHVCTDTGARGDNDPVDVCEIGRRVWPTGTVRKVKILGVLAMIDEGETDWKLVAIDTEDPMATVLNDIGDVERHMPGLLPATHEWFRVYKIPTGKPPNEFAFNGEFKPVAYALQVLRESHESWKSLVDAGHDDISIANTTLGKTSSTVPTTDGRIAAAIANSEEIDALSQRAVDPALEEVHYVGTASGKM